MNRAPTSRGMALREALEGSVTLGSLLAQARISREWFEICRPVLGTALASQLRAGPIEEGMWTLLAESGQTAAKARQLVPRVLETVMAHGASVSGVKVKVSPRLDTGR